MTDTEITTDDIVKSDATNFHIIVHEIQRENDDYENLAKTLGVAA